MAEARFAKVFCCFFSKKTCLLPLAFCAAASLSACNSKHTPYPPAPASAASSIESGASSAAQAGLHLAYTHQLGLVVPPGTVSAHYDAARDRCLKAAAFRCVLIQASIDVRDLGNRVQDETMQTARLAVRLPHDQIAPYTSALTAPLAGESAGTVRITHQSTDAVDLTQPIADNTARLAQLTNYRDSLKAFEGRLTISVADLVKIAGELSQVQSQIETAQAEQRELQTRVETELLDIDFNEDRRGISLSPIVRTWSESAATLQTGVASALEFSIEVLPWVPIGALGLLLLAVIRRILLGPLRRRG
jgi:hypothetical protein